MKALKTKGKPIDKFTESYIERVFGVLRWIWNWTLAYFFNTKKTTGHLPKFWNEADKELTRQLHACQDKKFVWLLKHLVSRQQIQETEKNVKVAFKLCKNKKVWAKSHGKAKPHFKARKTQKVCSFRTIYNGGKGFTIESDHIVSFQTTEKGHRGKIRVSESLAFLRKPEVKLQTLSVRRQGGDYWVCIAYERPNHKHLKPCKQGKLGIDLGVVKSVSSFDGDNFRTVGFNTKRSRHLEKMNRKVDKKMSNCKVGSCKYRKLLKLKQKRAAKAARIRANKLEDYTSEIAQNYSDIKIDDFTFEAAKAVVKKSQKKDLYRCMKYQFKLRLEQKARETGTRITYVEHQKGQKTTHKCCVCGFEDIKVSKKGRTVVCPHCGLQLDRDANAAANAYKLI